MESQTYVEYEMRVIVKRPAIPGDSEVTPAECAEWMQGREAEREIEREVLRALRAIDGSCDCEVMETHVTSEAR